MIHLMVCMLDWDAASGEFCWQQQDLISGKLEVWSPSVSYVKLLVKNSTIYKDKSRIEIVY
jgi:hypothetical protein